MDWTHDTYETAVANPEVAPEKYNPAAQSHNPPSWLASVGPRDSYEAAARAAGVEPQADAEIKRSRNYLADATFNDAEWRKMSRGERVRFKLAQMRLRGMEAEQRARLSDPALAAKADAEAARWQRDADEHDRAGGS